MDSPPGLEPQKPKTRIPEGSPPDDDNNDDDDDDDKRKKEKKSKKDKKRKKKKRDSSTSSSSSSIPRDVMKALLKKMIKKDGDDEKDKDKGDKEKKEKTKAAEKVVFPKFPQPENYRNWRLRVREAVVAASNNAFKWLSKVWDKDTKIDDLRDTEGFPTLDAKVLSAITNVLEGEFARQIDSFKEPQPHAGRLVRGRQVLAKLDAYFATSALHGSLYELEDLLGVKLINENLITFMSNWDTVLSGMKVTPDDTFLEPLFHRQVKKCKSISHDIAIYERATEGAKERSYAYLYQAASNYLARRRLDRNRERMARQLGDDKPALPAAKRVPKGFCISFVKNGLCKLDNCKYKHQIPDGWKDRSQSRGRGGRSQSRRRTGSPSPAGRPRVCKFYKQGRCDRGKDCKFLHTGQPGAAATSNSEGSQGRGSDKGKKGRRDKRRKERKKSRSSSKSSKGSRISKGSKGGKGSGKGKRSSASTAAAVCLLGAMLAGATPQADAFTFRKEVSHHNSLCHSTTNLALPAVSFHEISDCINVPIRDPYCNFTAVREPRRRYSKEYPVGFKPQGSDDNLRDAVISARMLRATIDAHEEGFKPKCNYECDTEFGCNHCIPKGMRVSCPAKISGRDTLNIEWIADTGSAQDLIARREL